MVSALLPFVLVSFAVGPIERLRYAVRLRRGTHERTADVVTERSLEVVVTGSERTTAGSALSTITFRDRFATSAR